jgi:hypothetical protein
MSLRRNGSIAGVLAAPTPTARVHYRRLAEALRNGSDITEKITDKGLGEREAYRLEKQKIEALHKRRPGQLWNSIDERFVGMTWQDYLKIKWGTIPEDDGCRRDADVPLRSTPISAIGRFERWASTERSSARALTKGGPSSSQSNGP